MRDVLERSTRISEDSKSAADQCETNQADAVVGDVVAASSSNSAGASSCSAASKRKRDVTAKHDSDSV